MEKLKRSALLALVLTPLGFGCSSAFYFHRDSQSQFDRVMTSEWHHGGFVELSEPVSLTERCMGEPWETVRISKSLPMSLVTSFTLGLYDPFDVSYACKGD